MRSHLSSLLPRMIRAGMRHTFSRYRIVAVGLDSRFRPIAIRTNLPRLPLRGLHAEERVLASCPRYLLSRIFIARVNARGDLLPIDACSHCAKLARRRGVEIVDVRKELGFRT